MKRLQLAGHERGPEDPHGDVRVEAQEALPRRTAQGVGGDEVEADAAAATCNAGDWSAVAFNTTGDINLATFNSSGNYAISLVIATSNHLYVAFNHATRGAQLYRSRTGVVRPATLSDFEGRAACTPGVGCEGLGGDGFGTGTPVPTRIFSGAALTFAGKTYVYVTAGNGTAPVRIFRILD